MIDDLHKSQSLTVWLDLILTAKKPKAGGGGDHFKCKMIVGFVYKMCDFPRVGRVTLLIQHWYAHKHEGLIPSSHRKSNGGMYVCDLCTGEWEQEDL